MLAAVHLDRVEAGVAGLAGDGGSVGTVAGALCDKPSAQGMTSELGESGWVEARVVSTATDGLVWLIPLLVT